MKAVTDILGGIGILIALYLVISQAGNVSKLITSLSSGLSSAITVLQGREVKK